MSVGERFEAAKRAASGMGGRLAQLLRPGSTAAGSAVTADVAAARQAAIAIAHRLGATVTTIETTDRLGADQLAALRADVVQFIDGAGAGRRWLTGSVPPGASHPTNLTLGADGLALPEPDQFVDDAASRHALLVILRRAKGRAEQAAASLARYEGAGPERTGVLASALGWLGFGPAAKKSESEAEENVWVENIKTIGIALIIALIIRAFLFQPFNIPSGSMMQTLLVGDYLFVSKYAYGYSSRSFPFSFPPFDGRIAGSGPERGDVVVFKNVHDENKDYIKRVIGLPGDEIQMIAGVLHINGTPVERRLVGEYENWRCDRMRVPKVRKYLERLPNGQTYYSLDAFETGAGDNTGIFRVPKGQYFMMGDNRDCSTDSRFDKVGYVGYDELIGRAEMIFFSVDGSQAKIWEIWNWPRAIRFGRMFQGVE